MKYIKKESNLKGKLSCYQLFIEICLIRYPPEISPLRCTSPEALKELLGRKRAQEGSLHCTEPQGVFGAESVDLWS